MAKEGPRKLKRLRGSRGSRRPLLPSNQGSTLQDIQARNHRGYLCEPIDIQRITRSAIAQYRTKSTGNTLSDFYRRAGSSKYDHSPLRYNRATNSFVYIGGAVNVDEGVNLDQTFDDVLKKVNVNKFYLTINWIIEKSLKLIRKF
mgnify:CR=1 FL=1